MWYQGNINVLNILVIDDEKSIRQIVSLALTNAGFTVDSASNGEEGIDKYRRKCFDVVITDITMPGLCGKEVARHIHGSNRPDTPVIGISGVTSEPSDGLFDAFLTKPFSLQVLLNTVENLNVAPKTV